MSQDIEIPSSVEGVLSGFVLFIFLAVRTTAVCLLRKSQCLLVWLWFVPSTSAVSDVTDTVFESTYYSSVVFSCSMTTDVPVHKYNDFAAIFREIISKGVRWVGHVAHYGWGEKKWRTEATWKT